nr:hypothetical protein [Streptococcus massiliensis]
MYSANTPAEYVTSKQDIIWLNTELEPQIKFEGSKLTEKFTTYKAWLSQKELLLPQVKFELEMNFSNYIEMIEFDNLERKLRNWF